MPFINVVACTFYYSNRCTAKTLLMCSKVAKLLYNSLCQYVHKCVCNVISSFVVQDELNYTFRQLYIDT